MRTWNRDRLVVGVFQALPTPFSAELCAAEGIDYICVDQQHGLVDYTDLRSIFPAIERHGKFVLSRVPSNEGWLIGRTLDAGATGVIVPMVNSRAEAEQAVRACRYAPEGTRSFGPLRAAVAHGTAAAGELAKAMCFVMVETREGIRNLAEIAATPGLDGIYVGPADLGLSLGVEPTLNPTAAEHLEAVIAVAEACREAGIIAGIQCSDGARARGFVDLGFTMVTIAKDTSLIQAGVTAELAGLRSGTPAGAASAYT